MNSGYIKSFINGLLGGLLIILGCCVYLITNNIYIGAFLFSIALYNICINNYFLYTGKIGYIIKENNKQDILNIIFGLLGNIIGTFTLGIIIGNILNNIYDNAHLLCVNKLNNNNYIQVLIKSFLCGILMYIAVNSYKKYNKVINIFLCVPVFILCGFEHSIANMGYFSLAKICTLDAVIFIIISIIGNSIGSILFSLLDNLRFKLTKN